MPNANANGSVVEISQLSLPKGGGAISGNSGSHANVGPTGAAAFNIPLGVCGGRGLAPELSLNYSSSGGNGCFGMGWQCTGVSIRRQTRLGVPRYDAQDIFIGPEGEALLPALNDAGQPDTFSSSSLLGVTLPGNFGVTRYTSRVISGFSLYEYWAPVAGVQASPFWLIRSTDGQSHLLGFRRGARLQSLDAPDAIAVWYLEESLSLSGEHIVYEYRHEDEAGCALTESSTHPKATQCYLSRVMYGNLTPFIGFMVSGQTMPAAREWLFWVVFDYAERSTDLSTVPAFEAIPADWSLRLDCFSNYEFGFEVRTRRLCHQILTFHRTDLLAGGDDQTCHLISRYIFDYEADSCATTLTAYQHVAHEPDGTVHSLPPAEFDYARLSDAPSPLWIKREDLDAFNLSQPYQMVDLLGEGIAGILFQDKGAWWYREPLRDSNSSAEDSICYGQPFKLPSLPGPQQYAMLTDLNADGRLDWLVTAPGCRGYFTLNPDKSWNRFIPLGVFPTEFHHPGAMLTDLLGSGRQDLVLIGPRSVRIWASADKGVWGPVTDTQQLSDVLLPVAGRDERRLIAFSDVLGSGQQHLVEVSAQGVRYWPNLGNGKFGSAIDIPGFQIAANEFSPGRVYLADIDGSGTTDLLYLQKDGIAIYFNQSGNRFAEPRLVLPPDGQPLDTFCHLNISDVQGLGVASLLLTRLSATPRHWCCQLVQEKPLLLNVTNNNMGAHCALHYRSSAQSWLDEKAERLQEGKQSVSHLPFPIHTLCKTVTTDEITGNTLVSETRYRHGIWDGRQREFRGFGYLEQLDTHSSAIATAELYTAPSLIKRWYFSGVVERDHELAQNFWSGDSQAFARQPERFTEYDRVRADDTLLSHMTYDESYWLHRCLKGQLLRSEVFEFDTHSALSGLSPYTVSEFRYQVRRVPTQLDDQPAGFCYALESRQYNYEQIADDPVCTQTVQLKTDAFGATLQSISLTYPRRPKPVSSPYPNTFPAVVFEQSYDPQQAVSFLTLQRASWHHLTTGPDRVLGLPDGQRTDCFTLTADRVPVQGFTAEYLESTGSPLSDMTGAEFAGQQKVVYSTGDPQAIIDVPLPLGFVAYRETTVFDENVLQAFDDAFTSAQITEHLSAAGYQPVPLLFNTASQADVWAARTDLTWYGAAATFHRPVMHSHSPLIGKTRIQWDRYYCVVTQVTDAAGLTTRAEYDYRFLLPYLITDSNDNQQYVAFDPFARITQSRFWGTEDGERAGYSTPVEKPFIPPRNVTEALELGPQVPVATCYIPVAHCWMPKMAEATPREGILSMIRRWKKIHPGEQLEIQASDRLPPHVISLQSDRYDNDLHQQVHLRVRFNDGFGRVLQTSVRHSAGEAFSRTSVGGLAVDESGNIISDTVSVRWAVSGRTEYDNKGQPVRTWQPFYLDDWRWVADDSSRSRMYVDMHLYDALGREYRTITAAGWERKKQYFAWFTVVEDENDTAQDVLQASRSAQ